MGLQQEIEFYMRRSQEYFALIAKMEAQREEWRLLYRNDSLGHQNAQTLLQEALVTSRTQLYRAIQMINAFRAEKNLAPIADEVTLERELRAFPVGVAEETAKRLAVENTAVAPQIDPVAETAKIDAEIPVPEGVVDESHAPAPETDPQTS